MKIPQESKYEKVAYLGTWTYFELSVKSPKLIGSETYRYFTIVTDDDERKAEFFIEEQNQLAFNTHMMKNLTSDIIMIYNLPQNCVFMIKVPELKEHMKRVGFTQQFGHIYVNGLFYETSIKSEDGKVWFHRFDLL